jgi:SNF family Na+-dependent transporter
MLAPGLGALLAFWLAATPCAALCVLFTLIAVVTKDQDLKKRSGHRAVMALGATAVFALGSIPLVGSLSRRVLIAMDNDFEPYAIGFTLLGLVAIFSVGRKRSARR